MEAIAQLFHEFLVDAVFVDWDLLLRQDLVQAAILHLVQVLLGVQVGDLSGVQDVVHILEEALVHYLSVIEDEGSTFLGSSSDQHLFL